MSCRFRRRVPHRGRFFSKTRGAAVVAVVVAGAGFATASFLGKTATAASGEAVTPADVRRTLTLHAVVARNGKPAGTIVVQELIKAHHVTVTPDWDAPSVLVRGGTCKRPGRGRSIHVHGSGEADVAFGVLRKSTFAIETIGPDTLPLRCAEHRAGADLATDVSPGRQVGKARRTRTAISFRGDQIRFRLMSADRGAHTQITVTDLGGASPDTLLHLRRGTCHHVEPGRELPLTIPGDSEADRIQITETIGVRFDDFLRRPWVLEVDLDFGFIGTRPCVEL
jgi:hypothetical protein